MNIEKRVCENCRDFEWREGRAFVGLPAGQKYSVCIKDPDDPTCVKSQEMRYCFRPAIAVTDEQCDHFIPLGAE